MLNLNMNLNKELEKEVLKNLNFKIKANETRLKGIKDMDSDMITDSSEYQYLANSAYGKINK